MTKRAKIIAMVQLPPPMHGAAKMNQHAVEALSDDFDLRLIEMRFATDLSDIARVSLRKCAIAIWLLLRLIWALPGSSALYICFAPTGGAYYRDCLYVLMAKMFGVPAILHIHGRGLPTMRQSRLGHWFQNQVFAKQTVILLGETLRSEVDGLACNIAIIPNCLDDTAFATAPTGSWHPHKPVQILWLSNLFRAKGIETLIAACAVLRDQGMPCNLTIAGAQGDMNEADINALLADCAMTSTARYFGAVSQSDRKVAFDQADLFVFPSHYANEAQPLVVLEAMAAGIPVITSNIATLPEFVRDGETGRLCPPENPAALANAIRDAVGSPEQTTKMRDAAYRLCQDQFRCDQFARSLSNLVCDVIGDEHQNTSHSNRVSAECTSAHTCPTTSGPKPDDP
ncbi:glycosyltransferase family 4 protein [Paremcibacter congregatus]|uniref:glycosyltransferase family 4 protein n=1 Tax=Paremcibacter congregatus TaxID=2043170 RepID=UPI003A95B821